MLLKAKAKVRAAPLQKEFNCSSLSCSLRVFEHAGTQGIRNHHFDCSWSCIYTCMSLYVNGKVLCVYTVPTSISKYLPYHNISWIARITAHLVASWRGVRISAAVCETCVVTLASSQAEKPRVEVACHLLGLRGSSRPSSFQVWNSTQKLMILHEHQLPLAVAGNSRPKVPPMWLGAGLIRVGWHKCTRSILFAFELLLTGYHAMHSFYKLFCQGASAEPFIPRLRKNASAVASMLVLGKSTAPGGLTVHHSSRWAANFSNSTMTSQRNLTTPCLAFAWRSSVVAAFC